MENKFLIVYERLQKLGEGQLCDDFANRVELLKNNFNKKDCWKMVVSNIEWLLNGGKQFKLGFEILTTKELTEWFSEEELNENGIYSKGDHKVQGGKIIGIRNCKLEVAGHTEVCLFDTAFADCYDTTFCKGYDNSTFRVNDCIGYAFGNSKGRAIGISIIENWTTNEMEKGRSSLVVDR